jgi:formate dehydrogenase major subunit
VHEAGDDFRHPYLAFQHELCISCGRCVRACDEVQGAFALTAVGRGFNANITAGLDAGFEDSSCVSCGACADTCPTDAITEIRLLDGNGAGRLPLSDDHRPRVKRRLPSQETTER